MKRKWYMYEFCAPDLTLQIFELLVLAVPLFVSCFITGIFDLIWL